MIEIMIAKNLIKKRCMHNNFSSPKKNERSKNVLIINYRNK